MAKVRKNGWTAEEERILKENYETHTVKELLKLLPNRTEGSIYYHAGVLGLRKQKSVRGWTKYQDDFLKKNYKEMNDEEISNIIGKSRRAVEARRRKLKLFKRQGKGKRMLDGRSRLTTEQRVHVLMSATKLTDQCKSKSATCKCKYCKRAREIASIFDNPSRAHILYEKIKPELELLP